MSFKSVRNGSARSDQRSSIQHLNALRPTCGEPILASEALMARWLVVQLDGLERRVPKSVALLAVRRGEAIRPDPNLRVIVEKVLRAVPSSLPQRFDRPSLASLAVVDPLEVLKRCLGQPGTEQSRGLLVNYPIKDQRGKLGKTPKPGAIARAQKNTGDRL